MRIVLTTKAGKQAFSEVKSIVVIGPSLYVLVNGGEINRRELSNCLMMEVDFETFKATGRADTTTPAT